MSQVTALKPILIDPFLQLIDSKIPLSQLASSSTTRMFYGNFLQQYFSTDYLQLHQGTEMPSLNMVSINPKCIHPTCHTISVRESI